MHSATGSNYFNSSAVALITSLLRWEAQQPPPRAKPEELVDQIMIGAQTTNRCDYPKTTLFLSYLTMLAWLSFGMVLFNFVESPAEREANGQIDEYLHNDDHGRYVKIVDASATAGDSAALLQRVDVVSVELFTNSTSTYINITYQKSSLRDTPLVDFIKKKTTKWDLLGSLFFCMTVVTTIGYGNTAPSTDRGKFLCVLYAIVGVPLCFNVIGQIRKAVLRVVPRLHSRIYSCRLHLLNSRRQRSDNDESQLEQEETEADRRLRSSAWVGTCLVAATCFYSFVFSSTGLIHHIEGWSYLSGLYYTFITFTTIGFGDFIAGQRQNMLPNFVTFAVYRIFLSFYIFSGMAFASLLIHEAEKKVEYAVNRAVLFLWRNRTSKGSNESESAAADRGLTEIELIDSNGAL